MVDCINFPDVFISAKLIYWLSSDIEVSTAIVFDKYVLNNSFPSLSNTTITDLYVVPDNITDIYPLALTLILEISPSKSFCHKISLSCIE